MILLYQFRHVSQCSYLLFQVNEECQYLRETLSQVEEDCQAARAEVGHLQGKVQSLEQAIQVSQLSFIKHCCIQYGY